MSADARLPAVNRKLSVHISVPQTKSSSIITVNLASTRWLLFIPILVAIVAVWFSARWLVGATLAEYAPSADQGGLDIAAVASRWAPDDPMTHWSLATLYQQNFSSDNLDAAVREARLAVEAAPYDYRYWLELGHALEADGDPINAEKAARRAVELAPAYSQPQWFYGNLLLRQGKDDQAFEHLSRAASADEGLRQEVFNLAWQVFNPNVDLLIKAVPDPVVRLQFVVYLIDRGNSDEAALVLRSVSENDRIVHSDTTRQIVKSLIAKRQFHAALTMLRELEPEPAEFPNPEQIWNGGFENKITLRDETPFHWYVNSTTLDQISFDTNAHSGHGCLKIVFKAPNNLEGIGISQTVIVEPQTAYRLQFYQRADNLLSAGTPGIAVVDPSDNTALAAAPTSKTGTYDWQQVTIDFKSKQTDGIQIVVYRGSCGAGQSMCPIFGTIWYDDFNLQRVSGSGSLTKGESTNRR